MKKEVSLVVILSLVLSLVFLPTAGATSVKWVSAPFKVSHIFIDGSSVYLAGTKTVYDKIAGKNVDIIDLGVGHITDEGLAIDRYWIPPQRDSYTFLKQYEKAPIKAIAKIEDKYIVATMHAYYIWQGIVSMPNDYGNGAGLDDISVINGHVYGTRLGVLGEIDISNGHFTDLTSAALEDILNKEAVDAAMFVVFPYKNYVVSLGVGAILFFKQEDGGLKLVKSYIDKDVDSRYDLDSDSALQGGYAIWKHYIMLPDRHYNLIRVVDLDSGEYFAVKVPDGVYRVATDGTYLYGATPQGKVFAFDVDIAHERLGIVWQIDLKKPVYSIAAGSGYVYVATGEKKIGLIKGSQQFTDVSEDYWAYDAIKYLASEGVISGYPDGTFRPERSVTRAEFAKMLATAMNLKLYCDDTLPEIYKDVHAGDWYCQYITPVVKAGYMKGYGGGRFGPSDKVKKEEIITTIVRIKGWTLINPSTPTFPDVPRSHWSYRYIETALKHSLVKKIDPHITDGKFHLGVPATRAQTAVFIYRMKR